MAMATPTPGADVMTPAEIAALQQEVEQWMLEDRLQDGEPWYLVASAWWRATFPPLSNANIAVVAANDFDDANKTDGSNNSNDDDDDVDMNGGGEVALSHPKGKATIKIENASLVDAAASCHARGVVVLRPRLAEERDYRIVSKRVWRRLAQAFGVDWEIARAVVTVGTKRKVDVYPILFRLSFWRSGMDAPREVDESDDDATTKPFVLPMSETASLLDVHSQIQRALLPRLHEFFPALTLPDIDRDLQIAYRVTDAAPWTPLADAVGFQMNDATTTVADLHLEPRDFKDGDARFHTLLIESKYAKESDSDDDAMATAATTSDWRVGRFYSDVCANVWRFKLQPNQLIDAEDTDKKWYESRIIETAEDKVRVHYRGWTPKWDEWVDRLSPRLAPLHTRVLNWRDFRVGDSVQLGFPIPTRAYPEWRNGIVDRIDKSGDDVKVLIAYDGRNKWMDVQDEMLCAPGTHKAVNAATTVGNTRMPTSLTSRPSYNDHRRDFSYDYGRGKPEYVGVVGLQNLGNTCFMNSMLQCLNNAKPLKDYFLASENDQPLFEKDVNEDNPLGMKGMIAREFAKLVHRMWGGEYTTVSPTGLKSVIGQYAPQFAGYQQQDSQEVMNFILDGLHEDLNRVKKKPYTESVERNGRDDDVVASEEWAQYLRRNDSVIVENFMGQLRSHVTCSNPECANESITFDPFMSLSVPIPSDESVPVKVQLFWVDGRIPTKYAVRVDKDATIRDIKEKLSALADVPFSRLFFVEVRGHRIKKTYRDTMPVDDIAEEILHVYELEFPVTEYEVCSSNLRSFVSPLSTTKKSMRLVALLHQAPVASPVDGRHDDDDILHNGAYGPKQRRVEVELFNTPLLLSFDPELTKEQVNDKIWQVVKRLVGEDASYGDKSLPYRLHITHPNGASAGVRDFPRTSDPALLPDSTEDFCFTLEWSRKGYHLGYDEKSAKRIELHESMRQLKISPTQDDVSLLNCLTKFTEREQLGKTDTWYCPKCKEHVRAYKKFDLFSLPKVMIFQLKRFRYAQSSFYMHRDKITTLVTFPIDSLDLGPFVIGPQRHGGLMYDLFAVSEHSGGLGGGHYTAIGKNPENAKWFSYNDSYTKEASAKDAVTPRAYVLFYVRRE